MTIRGIKGGKSLRELMDIADLPLSCTIGDWLRRMGEDRERAFWLRQGKSPSGE